jgi:hypothetical protein
VCGGARLPQCRHSQVQACHHPAKNTRMLNSKLNSKQTQTQYVVRYDLSIQDHEFDNPIREQKGIETRRMDVKIE